MTISNVYNLAAYLTLLVLTSCGITDVTRWSNEALINSAGQVELADRKRLTVLDELQCRSLDPNQYERLGQIFSQVIVSSRHSPVIRQRVMEGIMNHYQPTAAQWLTKALIYSQPGELRDRIIDSLVLLDDSRALTGLVLILSEKTQTNFLKNTPVGQAMENIAQQPLEKILIDLIADKLASSTPASGTTLSVSSAEPRQNVSLAARIAAVACLRRSLGHDKTVPLIMELAPLDETISLLRFWAGRFDYLPTNSMRFLQCYWQKTSLLSSQIEKLHRRVTHLSKRESCRFDPRDSYLLLKVRDSLIKFSRLQLSKLIASRLAALSHTYRPPSYPDALDDKPEGFADQCNILNYTDLLRIKLILDTLSQPAQTDKIRRFLKKDFARHDSEIGGLSWLNLSDVIFQEYEPAQCRGDNQFIESPAMIQDAAFCLSRWHCHTDQWRGKELAGPGIDDIRYAAYHNCPVVIFTQVTKNVFNVDYLNPEGTVIDLGNY